MEPKPFAVDLSEDEEFDAVCRPDYWMCEATAKAGKMPDDFYINNLVCHFLSELSISQLKLFLFCVEVKIPYRDYLPFADQVEWLFTEDDEVLGSRMALHYKVKSSLRAYVSGKLAFF